MAALTKRRRLEAALSGAPVDRAPIALWRHWPGDDQRPDTLAAAVLTFQKTYDFDFVKVTPASSYCLLDWGATDHWIGHMEGTREYGPRVIQTPDDWHKLKPLSPKRGALAQHIEALQLVARGLGRKTPFLTTIFNPLAQARNLAGAERLLTHLRQAPDAVHAGLRTITESTARLIEAAHATGISGIFYAIQHASYAVLSADEYRAFGRPYDLELLPAADSPLWLNLIHLHGHDVMFDAVTDYPAHVLNWHDREGAPTLAAGAQRWPGAVCGGLAQWDTLVRGTPEAVTREVRQALSATHGRHVIIGTGCVTPVVVPHCNLRAARAAVG